MTDINPSAGYTLTLRAELRSVPGTLGRLTSAIGRAGGDIGAVDLIEHRGDSLIREIAVKCRDEAHGLTVVRAARRVQGVQIEEVTDRTFELHHGG